MKLQAIGMLAAALFAAGPALAETSPDIFQITRSIQVYAGESYRGINVLTAPINKRMVVQSVSVFRSSIKPYATTQGVLGANIFNAGGSFPMLAFGPGLVGITTNTTVYVGAGDPLAFAIYRSGDLSGDEPDFVTLSGYYVEKPDKAPLP